jgi:hypothetical protein
MKIMKIMRTMRKNPFTKRLGILIRIHPHVHRFYPNHDLRRRRMKKTRKRRIMRMSTMKWYVIGKMKGIKRMESFWNTQRVWMMMTFDTVDVFMKRIKEIGLCIVEDILIICIMCIKIIDERGSKDVMDLHPLLQEGRRIRLEI